MAFDIVRCILEPDAKEMLEDFCERSGATQIRVMSKLIEWFARQPPEIQAAVQGHLPSDIMDATAAFIAKEIASNGRTPQGKARKAKANGRA